MLISVDWPSGRDHRPGSIILPLLKYLHAAMAKGTVLALLLHFLWIPLPLYADWSLIDGARVHTSYHGPVPRKSDVIFSTRFERDNAAEVAKAYGSTRIEWVYSTNPIFVDSLKSVTPWFGGALSPATPLPNDEGIAKDFDGRPIVAPWMKSWGAKWITTTDKRTKDVLRNIALQYLKVGANSIQIDGPLLQFTAANWGGDFSESSLAGFATFISQYPDKAELRRMAIADPYNFNYKKFLLDQHGIQNAKQYEEKFRLLPTTPLWFQYLRESVISHFADLRTFLNGIRGSTVPLSMNLPLFGPDESIPHLELVQFLDYAMVETNIASFDLVSLQAATFRSLGVGYVPSILPRTKAENRAAIAALYAMGAQPLVPWDVYIDNGPTRKPSRFFGNPEDYADLYAFVRDNAKLFDDYEELAVAAIVVPVDHYKKDQTLELVRKLLRSKVPYAIVPVGGTKRRYTLEDSARHFRVLLTVNPVNDFAKGDLSLLGALPIRLLDARALSESMLRAYSPFGDTIHGGTNLIARGAITGGSKIVLHVLRPTDGSGDDAARTCDRSIKFMPGKRLAESINQATWHSLGGVRSLPVKGLSDGVGVEIPDCAEWGIIEFSENLKSSIAP